MSLHYMKEVCTKFRRKYLLVYACKYNVDTEGNYKTVLSKMSAAKRQKIAGLKKSLFKVSLMSAWGGISSVQFALPLMWTESKRRGFTLQDIIRLMSVGPAKLARLENRKGKIEVRPYIWVFMCATLILTVTLGDILPLS